MQDFQYQGFVNPYANSMADEIARSGDAQAHAAEIIGRAQARAAELQGAGWGRAIENIGQLPTQIAAQQSAQTDRKLKEQELSMTIEQRQQVQAQRVATIAGRIAGVSHTPDEFAAALDQATSAGLLHPEITQHMKAQIASAGADPAAFRSLRQQYIDFGDQFQPTINVPEGGRVVRPSLDPTAAPTTIAEGTPKPPTEAELAVTATDPTKTPEQRAAAAAAMDRLKPKPQPTRASLAADLSSEDDAVRARAKTAIEAMQTPPKRTDAELALDTYAKSIGKTKAEDLTYAERQTFDRDKAKITSDQAYQQHMRERQYDNANPAPVKDKPQDALEQEYRTVLARGLSSRSGGLGLEDSKVQQANHLLALLDQTFDAKTGEYTIPKVLQGELAAGLARLVAPGGNVGIEMMREFDQKTAKGDLAGALSYITGHPFPTATQDIATMLRDSIERQGKVALENREGEMRYLRGLAPTDLEESRRTALEANSLNPLRQSRIAVNDKGERRLFVSTDGGKTWK